MLHTRQTMSPIAQPALDVMMQQMLKSQEQLQLMVAAQAAQYEKQERNNQHLIHANAQLQLHVDELLRERSSFTPSTPLRVRTTPPLEADGVADQETRFRNTSFRLREDRGYPVPGVVAEDVSEQAQFSTLSIEPQTIHRSGLLADG